MNFDLGIAGHDWDRDLSHDELLSCLADLKSRTSSATPILDDDDVDEAIDSAADRLAGRQP